MKILATFFDGSRCSEAIVPQLEWMARIPDGQFTFYRSPPPARGCAAPAVAADRGRTGRAGRAADRHLGGPTLLEDRGEAIERTLAERSDYLQDIAATKDPPPLAFCTEVPHKLDQPFAPRA